MLIKGKDATPFKRLWFGAGLKLASAIGRRKVANGGEHTALTRLLALVGYPLVFRPLLERVGLRRVRWAASGAAPIAPEVLEFFIGMGVPIFELYGMTENSAVATYNPVGRMKLGTVGVAYPGNRAPARPGDRRGADQARRQLQGLLGSAREDGSHLHRGRLAQDRRRRRLGRRDPSQDRRPDQGHHHHVGREERLAVRDREQAQDLSLHQGGDGDRRSDATTSRRSSG